MALKKTTIFRNIGLGFILLLGIVACEKDLEDIGVDLTDQRPFDIGDTVFEVIAYHRNIDSSRVDNNNSDKIPLYLLGVNTNGTFGSIKSDLVTQLILPVGGVDFGDNAIIDRVVLDIPYFSTRDGDQGAKDPDTGAPIKDEGGDTLQVPNFKLDSIYGNTDLAYTISVFELGTFLNTLDPEDPTKAKSYYSDKEYDLESNLFQGDFKPNRNDTVLYVERVHLDGNPETVNDIDTIKKENSVPSMKFDLDKEFFADRFVNHGNPSDFDSNDNFVRYFRGLYIDAEGLDGSLMNLLTTNATVSIYYTNEGVVDEPDDEDLNYNGVEGEEDVLVKTKQTMIFRFGGVRAGKYERVYGGSVIEPVLVNPDKVNGEEKLYVHGAGGSEVIIELLDQETLDRLRSERFLINEAKLVLYVDGDQQEVPERLFLYKYDFDSFLSDYYNPRFGDEILGGRLQYDDEGNPEKYIFRITDYMTRVLKSEEPVKLSKLALKNYLSTDALSATVFDTIVPDYNWDPKGVVIYGNRPVSNDKRLKLELFYSK